MLFRPARFVALTFVFALACGGSSSQPPATTDASVDATEEPGPISFGDGSLDALARDAAPATLVDGGGTFTCNGCPCDGRTHYCDISTAGPPVPDPPDAGCPNTRCKPYPVACGSSPSCSCITKACICERADSGDGLNAGCLNP